ncbi:hypothetical protein LUZ63_012977 [Rhynchospora breviuscula]|uniref:Reverse transcriptase zinc-binding domain-containing protein n=1 Tax=Rhynchospora breviuscula TaxID=2022672 RepID=A0A9Q0C7U8_9POAL|nr:hypothetical protein LUZ63_012977 [Rhynchospora breviuscula]
MNKALLTKWLWHWLSKRNNMWTKLVAATQLNSYSQIPEFTPLKLSFRELLPLLNVAINIHRGNGLSARFWQQDWGLGILRHSNSDLYSFAIDTNITLAHALKDWNRQDLLFNQAISTSASALQQLANLSHELLSLTIDENSDRFYWKLTTNGDFTVKSCYNLQKAYPRPDSELFNLSKLHVAPRIKLFTWRLQQNKLATYDNLIKRGWQLPNKCYLCDANEETKSHIFYNCPFTRDVFTKWARNMRSPIQMPVPESALLNPSIDIAVREQIAILFFILWKERCNRIFREVKLRPGDLVTQMLHEWERLIPSEFLH